MNSATLRLAASFVVALMAMGTLCAGVMAIAATRYHDERMQRRNASIAMYVEREAVLGSAGQADLTRLRDIAQHAMVVNPLARVYLLDRNGRVIDGGAGNVDLAPLRSWVAGRPGPVYGDDPANPGRQAIFSVHPVGGKPDNGYIYVVLGGRDATSRAVLAAASSPVILAGLLLLFGIMLMAGFLAVVIDRRARKAREQLATLHQLDQERRQLLVSIGHDLRTPLSAACGYLEALDCNGANMSEQQRLDYVRIIAQHVQRLRRLISQVFRLARLESPGMTARRELMSVQDLANDVGARFQQDCTSGAQRVLMDIDATAPLVWADCELVETVLENLLDNAMRHGSSGIATRLSVSQRGAAVLVSVQDSGSGMTLEPAGAVANLSSSRQGLGLVIVRRALGLLGTRLDVDSAAGRGTTVSFRLSVMHP